MVGNALPIRKLVCEDSGRVGNAIILNEEFIYLQEANLIKYLVSLLTKKSNVTEKNLLLLTAIIFLLVQSPF